MGRTSTTISEKQFRKAYIKGHGVVSNIAPLLGVTRMTVYNYCKRWPQYQPKLNQRHKQLSENLFNEYRGRVTVNQLAEKYNISATMVRIYVEKYARQLWKREQIKFPFPQSLSEFKVVKVLMENAEKPIGKTIPTFEIGPRIGIPQSTVEDYLKRYADQTAKKSPGENGRIRPITKPTRGSVHRAGDG